MGSQGFRNIAGNPFVYQEDTRSAAFGLDAAAQTWKIAVSSAAGALPTSTAQFTIDPATNGNVTIDPNGTGNLVLTSGNVSLTAGNLVLADTNATGTQGMIQIGANRFIHKIGTNNVFVGENSGNLSLTAGTTYNNLGFGTDTLRVINGCIGNCAFGYGAMYTNVSSPYNVAVGQSTLYLLASGNGLNTAIGANALGQLATGRNNIALGRASASAAGYAYTSSESSNICIGNAGVVGESNKIRIGEYGSGVGQQDTAYIAGAVHCSNGMTVDTGNATITSGNLALPTTTSTVGQITVNGDTFLHFFSPATPAAYPNIFIGKNSGNYTLGANTYGSVALGDNTLSALTTGAKGNCAFGPDALHAITSGRYCVGFGLGNGYASTTSIQNTLIGSYVAQGLVSGSYNVAIGLGGAAWETGSYLGAGDAWKTGTESSNIAIGHQGVNNESNVIHLGTTGSGDGQQSKIYLAATYGVTPSGTKNIVLIDSNEQLGSLATLTADLGGTGASTLTSHGVLLGNGTSAVTVTAEPSDGQLLIGKTSDNPQLATLTAGTNMTVTNGAGSISLSQTTVGINDQTDSYTLVLGDAGKLVTMTKGTANTLTIPKNSVVAFPVGTYVLIYQGGAGQTTISPVDGDVTLVSTDSLVNLYGIYSVGALVKLATDTWCLFGDLA